MENLIFSSYEALPLYYRTQYQKELALLFEDQLAKDSDELLQALYAGLGYSANSIDITNFLSQFGKVFGPLDRGEYDREAALHVLGVWQFC